MLAALANIWNRWQIGVGRLSLPRIGELAGWLFSLLAHSMVLVVLATLTLLLPRPERAELSLAPLAVEVDIAPPEFHFSTSPEDYVGSVGSAGAGGFGRAAAAAPIQADQSQIAYDLQPPATAGDDLRVLDFDRTLFEGPNRSDDLLVKGAGSIGTSAAAGAIDRLTNEILLSLDERPTLVVWLFDRSASLRSQREAIAKRFDQIYDELGVIEAAGNAAFKRHPDQPLLTAVAEFGVGVQLLTPKPTDDLAEIKASVRAVTDDVAGKGRENVFQSVRFLADKFRSLRLATPRRNVMIIVFTDEAGDDVEFLDPAVEICRKYEMPVYVVGVPAPFGRVNAYVKYVDPDPNFDQTPQRQHVHQGPESLLPERVKLLFGNTEANEEQIDSGFGPFGLCRLAYETGGLYFTVHPNREVGRRIPSWETAAMSTYLAAFFDPRIMRNYRPDYVSTRQYREILASNRACAALAQAAQLPAVEVRNVRLRFPKVDEGRLAADLSVAQREAARVEPEINQLLVVLKQGEKDREKLTRPRWQVGYDLAIGQVLAFKVRTEGYNAMLAQAKQGMKFKDEKNDTWELRPTNSVELSTALANDAQAARKYLERVVAEHAGTPWAMDAARELALPMGWEWREGFTNVARRVAQNANNVPRPERPAPPAKPRRPPPDL
jgi:hypothetical protein